MYLRLRNNYSNSRRFSIFAASSSIACIHPHSKMTSVCIRSRFICLFQECNKVVSFLTHMLKSVFSLQMDLRSKVDECCRTAEEFTKLYYDTVDKKRHVSDTNNPLNHPERTNKSTTFSPHLTFQLISRLYLDNACVVWNGNGTNGKDNIQKYFQDLPSTEHTVSTLDAQPIIDEATLNQKTILVMVSGYFKFGSNNSKPFQQTFMITAQGDKWKIVSDCFRTQDALSTNNKK